MTKFKIRITERVPSFSDGRYTFQPPCVEANVLYGDEVVGHMEREADGCWENGVRVSYCLIETTWEWDTFGRDSDVGYDLDEVCRQVHQNNWTMPKAQKELNKVLAKHRKAEAPTSSRAKFSPEQLVQARKLRAEGLSFQAIAKQVGGSGSGVRNALLRSQS